MPAIVSMTLDIEAIVPSIGLRHGHPGSSTSRHSGVQSACPPLLYTVSNAGWRLAFCSGVKVMSSQATYLMG